MKLPRSLVVWRCAARRTHGTQPHNGPAFKQSFLEFSDPAEEAEFYKLQRQARSKNDTNLKLVVEEKGEACSGELNGPRGPEPTRYGDWERKGRVSDF